MNLFYRLRNSLMTKISKIKFYGWSRPFWLVYDPPKIQIAGLQFNRVLTTIRKFDVILRKSNNFLDTYFIPGFWNHAGIYDGEKVVHIMADGLKEEFIFDFAKTDNLLILRPTFLNNKEKIEHAEKQLDLVKNMKDKKYDFSFDFKNQNRLSCTELVQFVFEGLNHELEYTKYLGKDMLYPDNIEKGNFHIMFDSRKTDGK